MNPPSDAKAPGRKKVIGVVVPSFEDTGGVPTVATFIVDAIARRHDLEARVISLATSSRDPCSLLLLNPATWRRGPTSRRGHFHGRDFVHVGASLGEFEFRRLAPRAELARQLEGCDLIQVVAGAPAWACPVLGLGKPVALQVATLAAVERRMRAREGSGPLAIWRALMTRIVTRLDEAALRAADVVMVENPWMQAHAESAALGRKVQVVYAPPGIDIALFRPRSPTEAPAPAPYVLAVGRFSDIRKNPMLLLRAYALVTARLENPPDLVLAGTHDPGEDFWAEANKLGVAARIRYVARPDMETLAALFRQALALAVSSDEEGFGIVVIEAMASAIPVVSTRCGGPDGIITDGVDGWLVDLDDAEAMATRLCAIVTDSEGARAMGRRARKTVEGRYGAEVAGNVYLRLYDELLAAPGAGET